MSEGMEPFTNDEWFEKHVMPRLEQIEYQPSGQYFINVGLCWKRHRYEDDYEGRIKFSAFPGMVHNPQDWTAHWPHAVRFLKALHEKLQSFDRDIMPLVDLRVYLSGAPGCRDALRDAFHDNVKRKGFDCFHTPFTWRYIPMHYNAETKKYEEKPDIYAYEAE